MVRCVNIDWLEVHCREPQNEPRNIQYYTEHGYYVEDRGYGTRVYKEMFTVTEYGAPFIEIRRNPASQGATGIHDANECHLRLVNRACYYNNAALLMDEFLQKNGYTDIRIKRVDVCLDFSVFDTGDKPEAFVRRYFEHKYAKINQSNIRGFGKDAWHGQVWNSVSWGSPTSQIYTKLYNKSLELYNVRAGIYKKPYILFCWYQAGLIDDFHNCTLNGQPVDVWRVEFTIQSPQANWMAIELDGKAFKYQSLPNRLETYGSRASMFMIWASLAKHYFRFKYFEPDKRKDRCKDKQLFIFNEVEQFFKIYNDKYQLREKVTETDQWDELVKLLNKYNKSHLSFETNKACNTIIDDIEYQRNRQFMVCPWSSEELQEFEHWLDDEAFRLEQNQTENMKKVKAGLKIKDRTFNDY